MTRTLLQTLIVSSVVAGTVASCVAGKPISEGQDCPCAPGWTCDPFDRGCLPPGAGTGGAGIGAAGIGAAGIGAAGIGAAGTSIPAGGGMSGSEDDTPPIAPGCGATCATPAGEVQPLESADAVYTVMQGRWEFCGGWQHGAPADVIGVDFAPASRASNGNGGTVGGKMYYLVAGPSGPQRGRGFAYELTYDVSGDENFLQLNIHPSPNSGFGGSVRYSPCPTELELNIDFTRMTLVRFSPGGGVKD